MNATSNTAIVIVASDAQSALLAESKQPTDVSGKTGIARNSSNITLLTARSPRGECLCTLWDRPITEASFDCVIPAPRCGTYFAQDDREIA